MKWLWAAAICSTSSGLHAAGYGIYDARTLALGGAGVAMGNTEQGFYYNPALMAFNDTSKNKGHNSRFFFPVLTAEASDGAREGAKIYDRHLDEKLTTAIKAFNDSDFSQASAIKAVTASKDIQHAIDTLSGGNLTADAYAGLAIAIPSDSQGGSFFMGSRLVGGGLADIKPADRVLLNHYTDFLEYVAENDSVMGAPNEGIFDANTGGLIDPTINNSINSTGVFRGAALSEVGVSASGRLNFEKADLALGITPKIVQANLVDEEQRVVSDGVANDSKTQSHHYVNFDVGAAIQVRDHIRVGFAVKDIISKHFTSLKGHDIAFAPSYRLGLAYVEERFSLGLDGDLRPSESFAGEVTRQDLALGGEYRVVPQLRVRAGYRHDISGTLDGTYSLGVGLQVWGLTADLAYATGGDQKSLGLQFGKMF